MDVASPAALSPYLLLPERALCGTIQPTRHVRGSRTPTNELDACTHRIKKAMGALRPQCTTRLSKAVYHGMPGHVSSAWYVLSDILVIQYIEPDSFTMLLGIEHRNEHRTRTFSSASPHGSYALRTSSCLLRWRKFTLLYSLTRTLTI